MTWKPTDYVDEQVRGWMRAKRWEVTATDYHFEQEIYCWRHQLPGGKSPTLRPIFDVDNMLRVYDYSPSLWATTVERDLPKMVSHIEATWDNRGSERTYMKLLHRPAAPMPAGNGAGAPAPR